MRLIVARCEVRYSGRLTAVLPDALRLIMIKSDGSVMVHADTGGYKPQNWMTPPTAIEESEDLIVVRKVKGEDRLDIAISEVLSDITHDMGEAAALEKDGVERDLQLLLAEQPHWCGEGLRLVRREWPTDIGPVDLMCRDAEDEWIAVEIKRVATIEEAEQLTRYLDYLLREKLGQRLDILTPAARGSQVSFRGRASSAVLRTLHASLHDRGFYTDLREPDVLRAAPVPLYNSYLEVWEFVASLEAILAA